MLQLQDQSPGIPKCLVLVNHTTTYTGQQSTLHVQNSRHRTQPGKISLVICMWIILLLLSVLSIPLQLKLWVIFYATFCSSELKQTSCCKGTSNSLQVLNTLSQSSTPFEKHDKQPSWAWKSVFWHIQLKTYE